MTCTLTCRPSSSKLIISSPGNLSSLPSNIKVTNHFTVFTSLSNCHSNLRYYASPIGRITRLDRSSVCPSVPYGLVTRKQKKRRKIKIGINASRSTSTWSANFHFRRSKVKVTGREKTQEIAPYLAYYGRRITSRTGGSGSNRLQMPNSLLDSAAGRTATYCVSTRR